MRGINSDHASYVKATVNSVLGQTYADPISRSWRRCAREYGLDPSSEPDVVVLKGKELRRHQDKLADVLAISASEVRNLYEQIAGSGFAVMFVDPDGVILDYAADEQLIDSFAERGLCIGGMWNEQCQGTNAMGTCLMEKEPLIVHQKDHFLPRNVALTCAGAPIYDHEGKVIAVLDASGPSEVAQSHTLALVSRSARTIENQVFMHRFRNSVIVRFHDRAEFVGRIREGVIAISQNGTILGANRYALTLLGFSCHHEIVRKSFESVFTTTYEQLIKHNADRLGALIQIYDSLKNKRYFATIKEPQLTAKSSARKFTGHQKQRRSPLHHDPVTREIMLDELALGDPRMALNVQYVKSVQDREIPIMIQGETGTGKEVMARAIHASRDGDRRPFIAVNCAAIPETLIESELFGYAPGAFTGALRDGQKGKIFQADNGTLFLDEIGDMPLPLQSRLLRVLEGGEVHPLGAEKPVKVDITVISATNRDLNALVAAGRFRSDLYYRLQGLMLSLPPLRERSDKRSLIRHMIELESNRYNLAEDRRDRPFSVDDDALRHFEQYNWPGNIRQLRTVIRVSLAVCAGSTITADLLPEEIRIRGAAPKDASAAGFATVVGSPSVDKPDDMPTDVEADDDLNVVDLAERTALISQLENARWNISSVARNLQVSRVTVYRKMKRLGIKK